MPSKTHHLLTILSAALCMAASAQNCALPPGTVGIGKYCTRDSVAIPIAHMTPNTKPSAPANATPEPSAKVSAVPGTEAAGPQATDREQPETVALAGSVDRTSQRPNRGGGGGGGVPLSAGQPALEPAAILEAVPVAAILPGGARGT